MCCVRFCECFFRPNDRFISFRIPGSESGFLPRLLSPSSVYPVTDYSISALLASLSLPSGGGSNFAIRYCSYRIRGHMPAVYGGLNATCSFGLASRGTAGMWASALFGTFFRSSRAATGHSFTKLLNTPLSLIVDVFCLLTLKNSFTKTFITFLYPRLIRSIHLK